MRITHWAGSFGCIGLVGVLFCQGCQAPRGPVSIHSDDPDRQIAAMKLDAHLSDRKDITALVDDLQSDDPAIRFYSIEALQRLTNADLGYRYYENEDERAPAMARWQEWLKRQPKPAQNKAG